MHGSRAPHWSVLADAGTGVVGGAVAQADRVGRDQEVRRIAEQGANLKASDYVAALNDVARLRAQLAATFARSDVVLTPCFAALPWPADVTHPDTIDGVPVGPRGHAVFTAFANAGGLPAISLPCRPSRSGLPIGIQLIGGFGADELLLSLAAQYERAHPWADRWPAISDTVVSFDADLTRVAHASGERRDVAAGVERWLRSQRIGVAL